MTMSTHVVLLRSKDDPVYQRNLKVLFACNEADVQLPPEIAEYFGGQDGIENPEYPLAIEFEPREWSSEMSNGVEIDVDQLPAGVKTIRFYNSW